jgi:hypothetical protein
MRVLGVFIALAVVLALAAASQAAPLDLKEVAADAKWLGHLDVDAIKASTVVEKAWHHAMSMHPDAKERIDDLSKKIGMDPRKDLHGITCYGKQIGQHEGVMIVHAKVDRKLLLEKAEKAPDHKVTKYGRYDLHTWTAKGPKGEHPAAGAFFGPEVLVFAGSLDDLRAALDVLGGKAASVGSSSPLAGNVLPGTTVLFRVSGIAEAKLPEKAVLAKQTESFRFATGEYKGESFFRAKAVMTNTKVVDQVKAMIEGARAAANLFCPDPDAKKMINAAKVTSDGTTLNIAWSASANDVWSLLEKHAKAMAERRAKLGEKVGGQ